jgi:hypothetical protein
MAVLSSFAVYRAIARPMSLSLHRIRPRARSNQLNDWFIFVHERQQKSLANLRAHETFFPAAVTPGLTAETFNPPHI